MIMKFIWIALALLIVHPPIMFFIDFRRRMKDPSSRWLCDILSLVLLAVIVVVLWPLFQLILSMSGVNLRGPEWMAARLVVYTGVAAIMQIAYWLYRRGGK